MHVQMASGIAIGAIVNLVRIEYFVDCLCGPVHVREEAAAVLVGNINDFTDMVLIRDDAAAAVALLFEQYEL